METNRYLFLVRQRFGEDPHIDSFYELRSPNNVTIDTVKVMQGLKPDWEMTNIKEDSITMESMALRIRFNTDMFPHVCLVKSSSELTVDDLEMIVVSKFKTNELTDFLKEARV